MISTGAISNPVNKSVSGGYAVIGRDADSTFWKTYSSSISLGASRREGSLGASRQKVLRREEHNMEVFNENKELIEYTTEQINHTLALVIMKKYTKEGKISQRAYEDMVKKYKNKILV